MAEGWARHLKGDSVHAYSAGIETHGLNPIAVQVMAECGVDISGYQSKNVSALSEIDFDYVRAVLNWKRREITIDERAGGIMDLNPEYPPRTERRIDLIRTIDREAVGTTTTQRK